MLNSNKNSKELEKENEIVHNQLDEIMGNKEIRSYEDGIYIPVTLE